MIKLLFLIIWIVYSLLEGRRDAYYYNAKNISTKPDNSNIHWIFFTERIMVWSLMGMVLYITNTNLINLTFFLIGLPLVFSWSHNGEYFETRHKLDPTIYPKGWFDDSTTSKVTLEFNYKTRTIMFLFGLTSIVISFML